MLENDLDAAHFVAESRVRPLIEFSAGRINLYTVRTEGVVRLSILAVGAVTVIEHRYADPNQVVVVEVPPAVDKGGGAECPVNLSGRMEHGYRRVESGAEIVYLPGVLRIISTPGLLASDGIEVVALDADDEVVVAGTILAVAGDIVSVIGTPPDTQFRAP